MSFAKGRWLLAWFSFGVGGGEEVRINGMLSRGRACDWYGWGGEREKPCKSAILTLGRVVGAVAGAEVVWSFAGHVDATSELGIICIREF